MKIAVVYYSGYNHTHVVAEHVKKGAESYKGTAKCDIFNVANTLKTDAEISVLNDYDCIIFGSPTYMGSIATEMKRFMDGTSKLWAKRAWLNKIAAGFSNSGSMSGDKLNTIVSLSIFAAQHGMIWVNNTLMPQGSSENNEVYNRIGGYLGLMTQANVQESSDTAPPEIDRNAAEYFGANVAKTAHTFIIGQKHLTV